MNSNTITIVNNIDEANAITHSGTFHADDIFSTIFLSKLHDIRLFRTSEIKETDNIENKIVYDIGFGKFDHHGSDAKVRDNKIKYSSFGLLFEEYGKKYLSQKEIVEVDEAYRMFLTEFILQIDAIDNGIFLKNPKHYNVTTLSGIIEMFNKTWKEREDENLFFLEALEIGTLIFNRIEKRILDKLAAKKEVELKIDASQNGILLLEHYLPFMDFVINSASQKASNILFAIFPSNRGGYNIRAINKGPKTMENRLDFPEEWGGKSSEQLQSITNILTFRFCHPNLFLCSCDTLEDAIKIAELAKKEVSSDTSN